MCKHTLDTPSNTHFIPDADIHTFPLVSIAESQANLSQTYTVIQAESLFAAVQVHEASHENNASRDASALDMATVTSPIVPFATPLTAPACGLAGGLYCSLPLDGSVKSIKSHLRKHGHRHPQRQSVRCPWMGCSHSLQWANIPRHIQSIHLGIRFRCSNCGKQYTRLEGLARHAASLKCSGATHAGM